MGYCTKCLEKPIVKNHMCETCETAHDEWLSRPYEKFQSHDLTDDDGFYTIYESEERKNGS